MPAMWNGWALLSHNFNYVISQAKVCRDIITHNFNYVVIQNLKICKNWCKIFFDYTKITVFLQ